VGEFLKGGEKAAREKDFYSIGRGFLEEDVKLREKQRGDPINGTLKTWGRAAGSNPVRATNVLADSGRRSIH